MTTATQKALANHARELVIKYGVTAAIEAVRLANDEQQQMIKRHLKNRTGREPNDLSDG